jgi:cytochrome b pre-mRNA-processing protein 3
MMSLLAKLFGETRQRARLRPLYESAVRQGRDPAWYREGCVPDTIDGRFDMLAAVVALILLRMEAEGDRAKTDSVLLTELFVEDMDRGLRQAGIGDYVVGKHVGRAMSALGGRLSAFRAAMASGESLAAAVARNVFHDAPPSPDATALVAERLERFAAGLATTSYDRLLAGEVNA